MSGQSVQQYYLPLVAGVQAVYDSTGLKYYRHADWLGSSRLQIDASGNLLGGMAYAPYGETYDETGTPERSFTGQTQDMIKGTTGIYDFLLRQQASNQGRWLVPDPAGLAAVDITNPQTWNRYAYVDNNPLSNIDPLGLDCNVVGSGESCGDSGTPFISITSTPSSLWISGLFGGSGYGGVLRLQLQPLDGPGEGRGGLRPGPGSQAQLQPQPQPSPGTTASGNPFQAGNEKVQDCLKGFYASKAGKAVNFFSLLSMIPGWGPEPGKSAAEWIGGGTAKYFGLKTAVEGSTGTLITLNTSTVVATVPEKILTRAAELVLDVGEAVGPYTVGAASLADIMTHYGCTVAAYPGPSVPSPF